MPERSIKRLERDFAIFVGAPLLLLIIGVFVFAFYAQNRNQNAAASASEQATRLCHASNKARREGNRDVRGPVRATATELATILRLAARQYRDPTKRRATFQIASRFAGYASRVQDLPQLDCTP